MTNPNRLLHRNTTQKTSNTTPHKPLSVAISHQWIQSVEVQVTSQLTVGQSVSSSWRWVPFGTLGHTLICCLLRV